MKAYKLTQEGGQLKAGQKRVLDNMCTRRQVNINTHWSKGLRIPYRFIEYMRATEGKEATVRLSTIHGAKGMEADRVILLTRMTQRVQDGMTAAPDNEHRVFYVGVTRAREKLDIVQGDLGYNL